MILIFRGLIEQLNIQVEGDFVFILSTMRRVLRYNYRNQCRIIGAVSASVVLQQIWSQKTSHNESIVITSQQLTATTISAAIGLHEKQKESILITLVENLNNASLKLVNAIKYCSRILEYLIYGIPVALVAPAAFYLQDISPELEEAIWKYLIWTIEQLGPTFIKFAQWASTRPDLYPPLLIEHLLRLQDNVTANYSMSTVEHTMETAFGKDWKNYISIDPKPLGAGCVAQVYKGKLKLSVKNSPKKSGNYKTRSHTGLNENELPNFKTRIHENEVVEEVPVAIKLIHPHVERKIKTDMELLHIVADLLDSFPAFELLSFGDTCRQFAGMMKDQLDLTIEASNLKKFSKKWAHETWGQFPLPMDGYISKNVLLETLMEGRPLSEYCNMDDGGDDRIKALKLKLSDLGCRSIIKMIFFDNFVHGDMHPGNILVKFSPSGEPSFVFLDCGIVFSAKTEHDHQMLSEVCLAFMKHDGRLAGQLMLDRNLSSRHKNVQILNEKQREHNREVFCGGLQQMIDDAENEIFFDNFAKYVNRICDLARTSRVKLDSNYFQVAMALKIVEGVALSLNRELDLITKCLPIVVKAEAMKKLGLLKFPTDKDD